MTKVSVTRIDFETSVANALRLLEDARYWGSLDRSGVFRRIGSRRVETMASLTLLRLQLAWEDFLEATFVRYLCGAQSGGGYQPRLLVARESSIDAATKALMGKAKARSFISWRSTDSISWAQHFFDAGEPFSSGVGAVSGRWDDMALVRNRFAHRSAWAASEFRRVVKSHIGVAPPGMTPGRFLLMADPATGDPYVVDYASRLLVAAKHVAP